MFDIHPSARDNFNSKVASLVKSIIKIPRVSENKPEFQSEVHVAVTISEEDIVGKPRESITNYLGETVGRFFVHEGERYGIVEECYMELAKLAESIQRLKAFRESLSRDFIEENMFTWLEKKFLGTASFDTFLLFLTAEAINAVKPVTVLVPIAHTIVHQPFRFCGTTIRNLPKSMIDGMLLTVNSNPDNERRDNATKYVESVRDKYQGYALVEIKLTCEPDFACELSLSIASKVTDLLGIYSEALLMPDIKCISKISGTENLAKYTTIMLQEGQGFNFQEGILDKASARQWSISKDDLDRYAQGGLGVISDLATKDKKTEFESTVLNMAYLYSKAAFTSDPMEKLVYILSALESTLLKNENEPIQQNLAERMAFFSSTKLEERKEIIRITKLVYGLRSRYLHHGHTFSEKEALSKFLIHVWVFYVHLVASCSKFKTKAEFLDAIDDRKLA